MLVYHEIVHFDHSSKTKELINKVADFMEEYVYPAEEIYAAEMKAFRESGNPWQVPKIISKLKQQLFPDNSLQERYDSFIPFYLKDGENFIERLKQNLNPLDPNFVILVL